MKVEIFASNNTECLAERINEFIKDKKVSFVKQSVILEDFVHYNFTISIWYEEVSNAKENDKR